MRRKKKKLLVARPLGPPPMVSVMMRHVQETIESGEFEGLFDRLPGFRRLVHVTVPWASEMLEPSFRRLLFSGVPARQASTIKFLVTIQDAWSKALLAEAARCDDKTVRMAVIRNLGASHPSTSVPMLVRANGVNYGDSI